MTGIPLNISKSWVSSPPSAASALTSRDPGANHTAFPDGGPGPAVPSPRRPGSSEGARQPTLLSLGARPCDRETLAPGFSFPALPTDGRTDGRAQVVLTGQARAVCVPEPRGPHQLGDFLCALPARVRGAHWLGSDRRWRRSRAQERPHCGVTQQAHLGTLRTERPCDPPVRTGFPRTRVPGRVCVAQPWPGDPPQGQGGPRGQDPHGAGA